MSTLVGEQDSDCPQDPDDVLSKHGQVRGKLPVNLQKLMATLADEPNSEKVPKLAGCAHWQLLVGLGKKT